MGGYSKSTAGCEALGISTCLQHRAHHWAPLLFLDLDVGLHSCCAMNHLWVLLDPLLSLLNVGLEVLQALLEETLLVFCNLADWVHLLNTVGSEGDVGCEVGYALVLVERRVDVCGLDNALLALSGLEQGLGEASTSHSHGKGGRSGTVLGLDDLITAELHALDVCVALLALQLIARLAEEGNNRLARVSTHDGDVLRGGVGVLDLGDESRGTDDIESGDTKELLGVVDVLGLEDLGADGNSAVNRVGDDEHVGIGAVLGGSLCEVAHNRCVGVEQV